MIGIDQLSDDEIERLLEGLPEVPDELLRKIVDDFLEIAQYGSTYSDLLVERARIRSSID